MHHINELRRIALLINETIILPVVKEEMKQFKWRYHFILSHPRIQLLQMTNREWPLQSPPAQLFPQNATTQAKMQNGIITATLHSTSM
jgi:hypothetical protein